MQYDAKTLDRTLDPFTFDKDLFPIHNKTESIEILLI